MKAMSSAYFVFCALAAPAGAQSLTPLETLGRALFFDTELSLNGNQACASCHSPDAGFAADLATINAAGSVMEGSVAGLFGNRKPPSAAYASPAPVFHHTAEDGGFLFVGGAFLDGRATGATLGNPTADQALGPFLNPVEMALPHAACVVQKVCNGSYSAEMAAVWGAEICNIDLPDSLAAQCSGSGAHIELSDASTAKVEAAFGRIGLSISAYESSPDVNRYSSKYDRYLADAVTFSPQEAAGLALFEGKAECSACHITGPGPNAEPALFTDFTYDNLGVPRNPASPVYLNAPEWVDIGLAGFLLTDTLFDEVANGQMGKFKVPTLRNVAAGESRSYMHNGYFKTLEGVVRFYNTRDVWPACNEALVAETQALARHCWPEAEVSLNVNTAELGDLKLTADEEAAIVAFLSALSDQ